MTPDQLKTGSVWLGHFDFHGNLNAKPKYFVLLNDCLGERDCHIAAITTSNGAHYRDHETTSQCGCPGASCFRIDLRQEACFEATTWIQFDNAFEIQQTNFARIVENGGQFVQHLHPDRARSVMNCAIRARDLTKRWVALIERTMKAQNEASKAAKKAKEKPA
jgi:hypothetical protein